MADFCKQCTEDTFGPGHDNDLSGLITEEDTKNGFVFGAVLCEGCGPIQVDHTGKCVSVDCLEKHGSENGK